MRILQSNEQNTTEQFGKSGLLSSEKLTIIYIEQIGVDEVSWWCQMTITSKSLKSLLFFLEEPIEFDSEINLAIITSLVIEHSNVLIKEN